MQNFYSYLEEIIQANFVKRGGGSKPSFPRNAWFDNECKTLKSALHKAEKHDYKSPETASIRKRYKQLIQRKKRQFNQSVAKEVDQMHSDNVVEYWKFWRRFRKNPQNNHIDIDIFSNYYKETSQPNYDHNFDYKFMDKITSFIDECSPDNTFCHDKLVDEMMNAPISETELSFVLCKAKCGKAGGVDGIPTEFYKYSSDTLTKAILVLFNYVFVNGEYPEIWSQGVINPIYKAKEMNNPENYRKITLLCSLGKLFDSILNNRLRFCKEALKLDYPWQNGFKQGSRATDNLFIFNAVLDKYKALKRPLYICYIDFKSAFDFVNRHALLFKLLSKGFTGKIFTILRNIFSKTKSRVKWNSKVGELFDNMCGVLQGGTISPALFNTYVDDMQHYFENEPGIEIGGLRLNHLLQADDLVLMSQTGAGLQRLLDKLAKYCHRWHLILNVTKTKTMVFNKKFQISDPTPTFTFNGEVIEECSEYKYLGVIFSTKGQRFKNNFTYLGEKGTRAVITTKTCVHSAVGNELPTSLHFKIFNQQVRPIMEYACEIWFQEKPIENLERIQLKYLKDVLRVRQSSSDLAIFGETGQFPLFLRQQDLLIKYWLRILRMSNDNVIKATYNELISLSKQGHDNFAQKVRSLISRYGYADDHLHKMSEEELTSFEFTFREERYSHYIKSWSNDLSKFPKLDTYRKIKSDYRTEPHILYVGIKRHQQALTRLRVSSHNLHIERGRHCRPITPRNERLCNFCSLDQVDDEKHFLMACKFHSAERQSLLEVIIPILKLDRESDTTELFLSIMGSKEKTVLQALAKFVYGGFQKRDKSQISSS